MDLTDVARLRLLNQRLSRSRKGSVAELVRWMGAMQAQDLPMAVWAVGVRLPESFAGKVVAALDKGEILRTHLLRPTWHFVAADDAPWILSLTAPHVLASLRSRHRQQGLTESLFSRSNAIIEVALAEAQGRHLLREELFSSLTRAKIRLDDNRGAHLLLRAELDGLICSGKSRGGKQTYALLRERGGSPLGREAAFGRQALGRLALGRLALRYFASHGPATAGDFTWWSGLPAKDARRAIELVSSKLDSELIGPERYWFAAGAARSVPDDEKFHLLPAYDEILIAYRDRSAMLQQEHHARALSINGIFRPLCILEGKVIGIWKRTIRGDDITIQVEFFTRPTRRVRKLAGDAAARYAQFIGKRLSSLLVTDN